MIAVTIPWAWLGMVKYFSSRQIGAVDGEAKVGRLSKRFLWTLGVT